MEDDFMLVVLVKPKAGHYEWWCFIEVVWILEDNYKFAVEKKIAYRPTNAPVMDYFVLFSSITAYFAAITIFFCSSFPLVWMRAPNATKKDR